MNNPFTLMLIDDDTEDREIFLEAVQKVDPAVHCTAATSGSDALSLLHEDMDHLPDVIFLDLNMPGMDGKQFLAEKAKVRALVPIPVFIYSTTRRKEDIAETLELGAAGFITKPVLFEDICRKIGDVLITVKSTLRD